MKDHSEVEKIGKGLLTFLPDKPIESFSEDQFGHSSFVNKLLWLIQSTEEHFNVGIFGKWGTGKTGILNMLKSKLGQEPYKEKYDYIYVDTWKLSRDSLRQQLLYQLSMKYDPRKSEAQIADKLFHTIVEPVELWKESWKETFWRLIRDALPHLALADAFILFGIGLDYIYPGRSLLPIVASLYVVPLVVSLTKRLAEASRAVTKTGKRIIPRIESPFEFAKMFKEIMGKRKGKKTIIALDNLDRCRSDLVVEMLSTVKAFMEARGVIFVVPCDDEALVQHLADKEGFKREDAREFLRKFFQISITIPPFIQGGLVKYVDSLAKKLVVPVSEGVKNVLIAAVIENPRRIKQFLNNYVINYQLALEREHTGLVGLQVLTGRPEFLAKIMVIKNRFPRFFDRLSQRDDLLFRIESYFRREEVKDFKEGDIIGIFKESPGLRWFLQRTRPIEVPDVAPFIRLAQETYESLLPEQEELKLRVRNNDYNYVKRLLEKADEDKKSNIVRIIAKIVEEDMRRQSFVWAFNELNVILQTIDSIPELLSEDIFSSFQYHCSSREMLSQLPKFDKARIFSVLPKMEEAYKNPIVTEYCRLFVKDGAIDQGLLNLIITNRKLLSENAKDSFNESLAKLYENNEEQGQEVIQSMIQQELVGELLTSKIVEAIAVSLDKSAVLKKSKERVELYESLKNLANAAAQHQFVVGLLSLFPGKPPAAPDEKVQFVLSHLNELEDEDAPASAIEQLYDVLITYMDATGSENHKVGFLTPIIRHVHKMPEDLRTQFLEEYIKPRLSTGQPAIVTGILETFSDSRFNILVHEEYFEILAERGKTNIINADLMSFLMERSLRNKKEEVAELLISHITSGNATGYNAALSAFSTDSEHLPRKEVDRICSAIIETVRSLAPGAKPSFFQSVVEAYPNCSQDIQDRIAMEILELIKQTEPLRSKGIKYYENIRQQTREEMRLHILRQLIINLSGTLDSQMQPSLDLIFDNLDILGRDDVVRLIDYLHGQISPAPEEQTQIFAMQYILKIPNLYDRGSRVLEAALLVSKSGSQTVKDLGKEIHKVFNRYKVPKEHWREAKEMFGEDVGPSQSP